MLVMLVMDYKKKKGVWIDFVNCEFWYNRKQQINEKQLNWIEEQQKKKTPMCVYC